MLETEIRKVIAEYNQKVVGLNQSKHMLADGLAELCIIAEDTEEPLKAQLYELCNNCKVKILSASSRDELAKACDIHVKTAIITLFNKR